MTNKPDKLQVLNEQELDALLLNLDIPAPDAEITREVSPWRHSMKLLLWGMCLCSIQLNFLHLNYILPALGAVLMVLALTPLRRESRWFQLAWWGVLGYLMHIGIMLFLQGTIWHSQVMESAVGTLLQWSALILYLVVYFAPLLGLAQLRRKAGLPSLNKWLLALIPLMVAYIWMALASSFPVSLPLLAFVVYFGLLIGLLRRAFRDMEQVGYLIHSRPGRLSALPLGAILTGFLILCVAVGMTVGQSYPMHWTSTDLQQEHRGQEALMAELVALGMPEHILMDLTAEDVTFLAGAKSISVGQTGFILSPQDYFQRTTSSQTTPDLILTIAAVSFTDDTKHIQILYHFHWLSNKEWGRTAAITVSDNFLVSEEIPFQGRVLCEHNTQTYSSMYYNDFIVQTNPIAAFPGISVLAATFSPPEQYTQLRGYLLVSAEDFSNDWTVPVNMRCYFRTDKKIFPAPDVTTAAKSIFSFGDSNRGFHLAQAYFSFNME